MRKGSGFKMFVVGVAAALTSLVVASAGLSDAGFTDPTGDATGGVPDITQIAVSNDAAGVVTLRTTTAAPLVDGSVLGIILDTDSNPATGSGGAEYLIFATRSGLTRMRKWNGTNFETIAPPSLAATISGNVIEIKIGRQDIGVVDQFGVAAFTIMFDAAGTVVGDDDAPDGGSYVYVLAFTQCANGKDDDGDGKADAEDLGCSSPADDLESDDPVTLQAGKALVAPAKPKAGKAVVVSAPVLRVETGVGIESGAVTCAARVGTRALRGAGKVASGRASCAFRLPATVKGKAVRGTITVTHLGKSKVVPFSFKVS